MNDQAAWRDRFMVSAVVITALAIAIVQAQAAWTRGFTSLTTYSSLGCAAYAGILALVLVWRAPRRPDTRAAAFMLAFLGACLSLVLVPSRSASFVQQFAFAVSFTWFAFLVRFAAVFPSPLTPAEIDALRRSTRGKGAAAALRDGVLRAQAFATSHPRVFALFGLAVFAWAFVHATRFAAPSYLLAAISVAALPWWYLLAEAALLAGIALGLTFLWTGYRLADEEKRQRVLVVVLCWTVVGFWALLGLLLAVLPMPRVLDPLIEYFWSAYYPVAWFGIVTGMGVGVLYSGAFDMRPLISSTTVYGTLVLSMTFLFAAVEELVQSLLANRLGLPEGLGTLIGAVAVAIALGPLRSVLDRRVGRLR